MTVPAKRSIVAASSWLLLTYMRSAPWPYVLLVQMIIQSGCLWMVPIVLTSSLFAKAAFATWATCASRAVNSSKTMMPGWANAPTKGVPSRSGYLYPKKVVELVPAPQGMTVTGSSSSSPDALQIVVLPQPAGPTNQRLRRPEFMILIIVSVPFVSISGVAGFSGFCFGFSWGLGSGVKGFSSGSGFGSVAP